MHRSVAILIIFLLAGCQQREDFCQPFKDVASNRGYVAELEHWVQGIHAAEKDTITNAIPAPNWPIGEYALNFDALSFKSRLPDETQARAIVEPGGAVSAIYLGVGFTGLVVENSDVKQSQILNEHLSAITAHSKFMCIPRD